MMIIFWLSAMGAVAADRTSYKYNVNASCSHDGSLISGGKCVISKRAGVASYAALDLLSGIAGLCALEMILFVAPLNLSMNGRGFDALGLMPD